MYSKEKEILKTHYPTHTFTIILWWIPSKTDFHSRSPSRFLILCWILTNSTSNPLEIVRHSILPCMLTFASWMFRPFLSNVSHSIQPTLSYNYYYYYHYYDMMTIPVKLSLPLIILYYFSLSFLLRLFIIFHYYYLLLIFLLLSFIIIFYCYISLSF